MLTVVLVPFLGALIGSLAQKRNTDWPVAVAMAEVSKTRRGHTNCADHRGCPVAPSTTCACQHTTPRSDPATAGFSEPRPPSYLHDAVRRVLEEKVQDSVAVEMSQGWLTVAGQTRRKDKLPRWTAFKGGGLTCG